MIDTRVEETTSPDTVEGIPWFELKLTKTEPQPASMKQTIRMLDETMLRETIAHYVSPLCQHATVNSGRRQRTCSCRVGGFSKTALDNLLVSFQDQ